MKQATMLHGTGGSNTDYFWFSDTQKYLEASGYNVWWPMLPHTDRPELNETANFLKENMPELSDADIIIGHSSACPLILYMLQIMDVWVKQIVLVSGFYKPIDDDGISEMMLPEAGFDFSKIKRKAKEFILINSDNDPWGCDHEQARPTAEALNAKFVLATGQGHMGSAKFGQTYREFPLLKSLLAVK